MRDTQRKTFYTMKHFDSLHPPDAVLEKFYIKKQWKKSFNSEDYPKQKFLNANNMYKMNTL